MNFLAFVVLFIVVAWVAGAKFYARLSTGLWVTKLNWILLFIMVGGVYFLGWRALLIYFAGWVCGLFVARQLKRNDDDKIRQMNKYSEHPMNPDDCYRNGKKYGVWERRYGSGKVATVTYVDDKKHGQWEIRHPDGSVTTGHYLDGKMHKRWEWRNPDGTVGSVANYVHGELQE